MTTVHDVPAKDLIDTVAKKLLEEKSIVPPEGCSYWRTGINKENPPENRDWWYIRCASVLRKLYITEDGIGIEHLRAEYGGNRDRKTKPNKVRKGSGAIVRRTLQQLEKAGYVTKVRGKGRILTPKGRSFLDKTSYEVLQSVQEKYPGLKKY